MKFVKPQEFKSVIDEALNKQIGDRIDNALEIPLKKVYTMGEKPLKTVQTVSDDITEIDADDYKEIFRIIKRDNPNSQRCII